MEAHANPMGSVPIKKLMLKMGLPMILSMMVQAFYNIVDSYFVAGMPGKGDAAMNAMTLAFPVQTLIVAIGVGTGVGVNALLSRELGSGDREAASRTAGNAIFLGFCTYIAFMLFGIFGLDAYLNAQGATAEVLEMGREYLRICMVASFGCAGFMIYEKLLQATGKAVLMMVSQMAGAVTNIILDPVLIYGWLGCPAMGVAGAAWATVIGQVVSLVIGGVCHHGFNRDVNTSLRYLRPRVSTILRIYQVGAPAIVLQALTSIMTFAVNIIFVTVSADLVTAYGIYFKIQQFVFFAAFGLNNAIIPIVAYNYGARSKTRIRDGIRYGMIDILVIMFIGMMILQLFAGQIMQLFALSESVLVLCKRSMHIVSLGFLFAGANIAFQGIFQALNCGMKSLVLSLLRLIVIALPLAWLFTLAPGAESLVWWAFPIAEAAAFVCALFMMRSVRRSRIEKISSAMQD